MIKLTSAICLTLLLSACTLTPEPMSVNERYRQAKNNVKLLFAHKKTTYRHLDYYHALALGLKHNLDYRIKLANNALQADQLSLAEFAMFPSLNVNASLYSRNNSLANFTTTTNGQKTDILNPTPNTLRAMRVGMSWNILDFGMSYVKAKQQGDRYLIAVEESRKQLQRLAQDIQKAYWTAYSTQELMNDTREFQALVNHANAKLALAVNDRTIPREKLLHFQEAMLDGDRQLIQLKAKYDKSILDLKQLLNLPMSAHITLEAPPQAIMSVQNLKHLDFRKIDSITLVSRPELRSQSYQARIAKWGIRTAILQALPGIALSPGWNYNSNKYLLNTSWVDRSVDTAWNLLNLASLPAALDTAEAEEKYEKLKLMALTLTALTETRYAYSHYHHLSLEYHVAHAQTKNASALYRLAYQKNLASLTSHQEVMQAKLKLITAKMDENALLTDLSTSLGELYLSTGFDIMPLGVSNQPIPVIVDRIKSNFAAKQTMDFKHYVNVTYRKLFSRNSR